MALPAPRDGEVRDAEGEVAGEVGVDADDTVSWGGLLDDGDVRAPADDGGVVGGDVEVAHRGIGTEASLGAPVDGEGVGAGRQVDGGTWVGVGEDDGSPEGAVALGITAGGGGRGIVKAVYRDAPESQGGQDRGWASQQGQEEGRHHDGEEVHRRLR